MTDDAPGREPEATVVGEQGNLLGVKVIDAADRVHEVSVDSETGHVSVHATDAYPADLDERSPEESERIRQAQRLAKYTLATERDRPELGPPEDPDRIEAVSDAIRGLSRERFETLFDRYLSQLASHYDDAAERPIPLPADVPHEDLVRYRQRVVLDGDRGDVAAVSGIELAYRDPRGERRTVPNGDPLDADPDATLDLRPADLNADAALGGIEAFRDALCHHLSCRIRDCYFGMGLDPPADHRVAGPGIHDYSVRYRRLDVYPAPHDAVVGGDG